MESLEKHLDALPPYEPTPPPPQPTPTHPPPHIHMFLHVAICCVGSMSASTTKTVTFLPCRALLCCRCHLGDVGDMRPETYGTTDRPIEPLEKHVGSTHTHTPSTFFLQEVLHTCSYMLACALSAACWQAPQRLLSFCRAVLCCAVLCCAVLCCVAGVIWVMLVT